MSQEKIDWESMIEIMELFGERPSPALLEIMKKEKNGEISKKDITEAIRCLKKEKSS